jgi:hypothetical protein
VSPSSALTHRFFAIFSPGGRDLHPLVAVATDDDAYVPLVAVKVTQSPRLWTPRGNFSAPDS